jgi:MFS family permease
MTRQTVVIAALGSAQTLAWGSTYYLPAILAEPMARDLGVSPGQVFGAFSCALVVAAFLGPAAGRRIDLFGGRNVLSASSLIFALGLALLGFAQGAVTLYGAWLILGVGMALGLYEAAFSTLAGVYGHSARRAITGITLLAGFASTICWPISAYLEAEVGWRATCHVWAAAHILLGLPLNRLFVPQAAAGKIDSASDDATVSTPNRGGEPATSALFLLACVFAIIWFISTAMAAHLPRLLQEAGATPTAAIAAAALVGPAQVAGRALEFGLLQRFHPLLSARLAALAHPVGALAVIGLGAPAAAFFSVLHGAGNGILTITQGTLPLTLFGPTGYGLRQGYLMVPARFCQATAPFLFALLMERYGALSLLLSTGLAVIGFAALIALNPKTSKEPS